MQAHEQVKFAKPKLKNNNHKQIHLVSMQIWLVHGLFLTWKRIE
jgi:hypothetical protein